MSLLTVEGLTVALPPGGDRAHAVGGVSFTLGAGEILCIVGESGSGKSVSAGAIMGLLPRALRVTGGRIGFEGRDLAAGEARRDAGAARGAAGDDLPGADDGAEPADAGGRPGGRGDAGARQARGGAG